VRDLVGAVVRTGVGVGFTVVGAAVVVTGFVVVTTGVVVAGLVVVGAVVVGAADVVTVFATMLVAFVAAVVCATVVTVMDGSCVACVREVAAPAGPVVTTTTVGRVVAAATFGTLLFSDEGPAEGRTVASSVGVHAGSWVACSVAERDGSATDELAAPPAIVTAPADSGPLNSWTIPMIPVSMNVVMSHNCQRRARTPMRKLPQ
jgi:hypothetical protein